MNLHSIRKDLQNVLKIRGLTQEEFSRLHGISYSWINKFLKGHANNPRLNSLTELLDAIEKERKRPVASTT